MSRSRARARVYKEHGTWFVDVIGSNGKIVVSDNTGAWKPVFQQALMDVAHVRAIENMGHRLKSWDSIVANA